MSSVTYPDSPGSSSWVLCSPAVSVVGPDVGSTAPHSSPCTNIQAMEFAVPARISWADEVAVDGNNLEDETSMISDADETSMISDADDPDSFEDELDNYVPACISTEDVSLVAHQTIETSEVDEYDPMNSFLTVSDSSDEYLPKCEVNLSMLKNKSPSPTVKRIETDVIASGVRWATEEQFLSPPACYSKNNLDRAFDRLGPQYPIISESDLFYQVDMVQRDQHFRTITMTGLTQDITASDILAKLRGGKVVRVVSCDTTATIGSYTAMVEFATAEAASEVVSLYARNQLLLMIDGTKHILKVSESGSPQIDSCQFPDVYQEDHPIHRSNVCFSGAIEFAFVASATMSKWGGIHTFENASRCIQIFNLHAMAKRQLALDYPERDEKRVGLESIIYSYATPDTIRLGFTSMLAAKAAMIHMQVDKLHYGGTQVVYAQDPCELAPDDVLHRTISPWVVGDFDLNHFLYDDIEKRGMEHFDVPLTRITDSSNNRITEVVRREDPPAHAQNGLGISGLQQSTVASTVLQPGLQDEEKMSFARFEPTIPKVFKFGGMLQSQHSAGYSGSARGTNSGYTILTGNSEDDVFGTPPQFSKTERNRSPPAITNYVNNNYNDICTWVEYCNAASSSGFDVECTPMAYVPGNPVYDYDVAVLLYKTQSEKENARKRSELLATLDAMKIEVTWDASTDRWTESELVLSSADRMSVLDPTDCQWEREQFWETRRHGREIPT